MLICARRRILLCWLIITAGGLFCPASSWAQAVTSETRAELLAEQAELSQQLTRLVDAWDSQETRHGVGYRVNEHSVWSDRADAQVLLKAVEWIVRHNEFSKKATLKQTRAVLAMGRELITQLQSGQSRGYQTGTQICGYVSAVDHSVQPYVLTLPPDVPLDGTRRKRYPLYVVLHGRGGRNEVGFLARQLKSKPNPDQQWIQIDVFGRLDNAYRWAGETDVFEAIADVSRRFPIDDKRISLWGFSMGGAGAWHLGLQHPSRWASVGAGAGFIDFYVYQKQTETLPVYQDEPLRIYDSILYARNLANVDFVTYGGELDKQLVTSQRMLAAAQENDVPLEFVLGKNIGHKFTPEGAAQFQAFLWKHNQAGLPGYPGPKEIRFVTYTPKYNECFWLTVEELDQTYQETVVESTYDAQAGTLNLETTNARVISVSRDIAEQISLDDEPPLPLRDAADALLPSVYFRKLDAGWELLDYDQSRDYQENGSGRKQKNLQGPIDDAFMQPFLCVRGTGTAWSPAHQAWADWTLNRFAGEFDKWMRAEIRIVNDTDVTQEMIDRYHLILFGDPGSNALIKQLHADLPIEWTADSYRIGEQTWATDQHGLALISPNPLNPQKYVVLNSGMTTHAKDFKASNSWLFPKLGDAAVLKFNADGDEFQESISWSTLLTDDWQLPDESAPEQ